MRHHRAIGAYALGIITGSAITGAIILATPTAHADPTEEIATDVCMALEANPTVGEVSRLLTIFVSDGVTPYHAGEFIGAAVATHCSRYEPVLQAFINQYGPANANGAVA